MVGSPEPPCPGGAQHPASPSSRTQIPPGGPWDGLVGRISIPKAIWPLSASWETLPDPAVLPTGSKGFCNGRWLPDFLSSYLENHFLAGQPSSRTPIRSLVERNQEQHLIPMEMPGGITPESETSWHEESPQQTRPLGLLVHHVGRNSEDTRNWGHPRTYCPLQPQPWVLLNNPFPPKPKSPHHSFRN